MTSVSLVSHILMLSHSLRKALDINRQNMISLEIISYIILRYFVNFYVACVKIHRAVKPMTQYIVGIKMENFLIQIKYHQHKRSSTPYFPCHVLDSDNKLLS